MAKILTPTIEGYPIQSRCFSNSIGHHNLTRAKAIFLSKEEKKIFSTDQNLCWNIFSSSTQNGNSDNSNSNNNCNKTNNNNSIYNTKLKMNPELNQMCFLAQIVFFASSCYSLSNHNDKGKDTKLQYFIQLIESTCLTQLYYYSSNPFQRVKEQSIRSLDFYF